MLVCAACLSACMNLGSFRAGHVLFVMIFYCLEVPFDVGQLEGGVGDAVFVPEVGRRAFDWAEGVDLLRAVRAHKIY